MCCHKLANFSLADPTLFFGHFLSAGKESIERRLAALQSGLGV